MGCFRLNFGLRPFVCCVLIVYGLLLTVTCWVCFGFGSLLGWLVGTYLGCLRVVSIVVICLFLYNIYILLLLLWCLLGLSLFCVGLVYCLVVFCLALRGFV